MWPKNEKGEWSHQNVPLGEGMVNFDEFLKEYAKLNVQAPISIHYEYDLGGAELGKKEIQEGLIKACNVIDLIIEILRGSKDRNMAKMCLIEGNSDGIKFKSKESKIMAQQLCFTENQANAILEMRLYKLIGLEIEALLNEHETTMANIYRYEDILARKDSMAQVIMNDLEAIKKEFSRPRRTVLENATEAVYEEKKPDEMEVMFLMDRFGYSKTVDLSTYERNKDAAETENKYIVKCKNTGRICIFTNKGQLYTIKIMDLPFGKFRDKGVPIDNVSNYSTEKEDIVFIASQTELNLSRMIFVTKLSMMKLVDGGEFDVSKRSVSATSLLDKDEVVQISLVKDQRNIVLQTAEGFFLRFPIEEIPQKKKNAVGVRGTKLTGNDFVENVYFTQNALQHTIVYKGKNIELNKIKLGKRDTKGVKVRV
ncbi:MAG: hypothetical protein HGA25_08635 [Clostridiales bacterium]|nr:hypothetical protein [Clostridiales bacterium]